MFSIEIHSTRRSHRQKINNVAIPRKCSLTTIFCILLVLLLQISSSSVVSGIQHIPPVHMHDVLSSDLSLLNNNRVLPAEIESNTENLVDESIPKVEEKVESWEDDDDDTISAVDSISAVGQNVNSKPANAATEGEIAVVVEKDIVSTDNAVKQQQWPDDDDDDTNVSANNDSVILNSVNNTSVAMSNISTVIPDEESDEKPTIRDKIKQKLGWNDDDDDTIHEELTVDGITTSEKSVEGEEINISEVRNEDLEVSDREDKKEGTVSEWPEDDDEDNLSVNNADSIADEQEDASLATAAADGEEKKSSLLSTFKKVAGWENGDEKEGTEEENSAPEAVAETRDSSLLDGIGEEDEATEAEMEEKEQVPSEWPEDDDDDNDAVDAELTNVPQSDNNTQNTPEEENEIQQGSSITNVKEEEGDVDELLGDIFDTSPEATAYHRNQSSQGDGSVAADEEVKEEVVGEVAETPNENVQQEVVEEDVQENTNGVANQSETPETVDNDKNATPTEDTVAASVDPNEVMIPNQQEGQQQQQPPIQSWDDVDDDDDSFIDMVQSTFNVLLLAVLLTSLLVLRKRVMDRVHTDGLSVPEAIKDELIDVVIRFASWSASVLTGTQNDSNNSTEDDTDERQNSRGNETIPLAADEEWGWEDEENQFGTELSGMGRGNEEKEDDDLAMAIAMSLSESQKEKKATISSPSLSSKSNYNQQPQRQSSSSSFPNKRTSPQLTSTPQPPPPSSSGGGDSIEDLLGQMGGSNKITSFGQKPKTKPKPAKKQQENNDDDLFASMGLSSIPKPTRPSAPTSSGWKAKQTIQQSAPKSAPTPSLVADSFGDDGGDDWGDDGDLDDLLDD